MLHGKIISTRVKKEHDRKVEIYYLPLYKAREPLGKSS